jgi:hypothetical protein
MYKTLSLSVFFLIIILIIATLITNFDQAGTDTSFPYAERCNAQVVEQDSGTYTLNALNRNMPEIQVFKATPLILETPTTIAVYTFKVKNANSVQINEAGSNIKNISNPSLVTLQGTATGLPASAITSDSSGNFVTIITASNDVDSINAELTLSFSDKLLASRKPPEQTEPSDNETQPRSPKWLEMYSSPFISTSSDSPRPGAEPVFFKCPGDCDYCLEPKDAAGHGFSDRCSEERCYYSPDGQRSWYCYKPVPGWCCIDGNVIQTTRDECNKMSGYWYLTQAEALERCQPIGYCFKDGELYVGTETKCLQIGGTFYLNQQEAMLRCQQTYWCCANSKVFQATQSQCTQLGGTCFNSQSQAMQYCQTEELCWCCSYGKVFRTTQAQCIKSRGNCFLSYEQAMQYCRQTIPK